MANPEHLAILKQGVDVWNKWKSKTNEGVDLRGANLLMAKLSCANLREADLSYSNLSYADLDGADISGAYLRETNLRSSNLKSANLSKSDLSRSDLSGANLSETNLNGADLSTANLSFADFIRTNLTDVVLGLTFFADIDLSTAQGLATAVHQGPSTIGIDTLYKSKGQIPEVFMRGCGVPESFITQAKALMAAEEGIQFYSCFISYSTKDEEFASRLYSRLQQEHIRVWFAPHDMKSGEKIHEQIDTAIKVYDKLLILLSPDSLQSNWAMTELRKARKEERKTSKRKLFPVGLVNYAILKEWECFDSDTGTDLAVEVREYFIPDFSHWKDHNAFELAFARLLKDLRHSTQPASRS